MSDLKVIPEISGLVKESGDETTGSLGQNYMQGVEKPARGLLKTDDSQEQRMGMNPMSEAIKRKFNQNFNSNQRRLVHDTKMDAQVDHLKKLEVASNLASEEHAMNVEKDRVKKERARAKRAARGQVLGSVLGIAGGVVGAVYGGGAGAMAGSALGQGVGNAVGGST